MINMGCSNCKKKQSTGVEKFKNQPHSSNLSILIQNIKKTRNVKDQYGQTKEK
jgi:hypothetical protein